MKMENEERKRIFRPRAKLLILLGEQLIRNEIVALSELVKNSYDADSTQVDVRIINATTPESGEIVVHDNGNGMSLDTVLNVWLEPATSFRVDERKEREKTDGGRLTLGEKGVGRFATHKLGHRIVLVTRNEESEYETVLDIDWRVFGADAYLDEVTVEYETRAPLIFAKNSGTQITVRNLHRPWTERMAMDLYIALQGLTSPFANLKDFDVQLSAPEFAGVLKDVPEFSQVVSQSPYVFEASIDSHGQMQYKYTFRSLSYSHLDRTESGSINLLEDVRGHRRASASKQASLIDWINLECGEFQISVHAWDLDRKALSEIEGGTRYYRRVIKPHTGVRVYRDGFRVWPYGAADDDWLSLDLRRVNNPTLRFSRNQVIGLVEISRVTSPELRDKTNREGLVENTAFIQFKVLLLDALSVFERMRRNDKNQLDKLRVRRQPKDRVVHEIDALKKKVERGGHKKSYGKNITSIKRAYRTRLKELLGPYLLHASLGIVYSIPIHELRRDIGNLREGLVPIFEMAKSEENEEMMEKFNRAFTAIEHIESTVEGVGSLLKKQSKSEFSLSRVVRSAMAIMQPRFDRENINCTVRVKDDTKIRGVRRLIVVAVLNLLDNSIYWVRYGGEEKRILVWVDKSRSGNGRVIVSDSGPGLQDEIKDIIQPFFTRKPDGSGLGLYIVDTIMKQLKGSVAIVGKRRGLLDGANLALVFKGKRDSKR